MAYYTLLDKDKNEYRWDIATFTTDNYEYSNFLAWNPLSTEVLSWSYATTKIKSDEVLIYNSGKPLNKIIEYDRFINNERFYFKNDSRFFIMKEYSNEGNVNRSVYNPASTPQILSVHLKSCELAVYYNDEPFYTGTNIKRIISINWLSEISANPDNEVPFLPDSPVYVEQNETMGNFAFDPVNRVFIRNLMYYDWQMSYSRYTPFKLFNGDVFPIYTTSIPDSGYQIIRRTPISYVGDVVSTGFDKAYNALNKNIVYTPSDKTEFNTFESVKIIPNTAIEPLLSGMGIKGIAINNRIQTYTTQYIMYYLLYDNSGENDIEKPPYEDDTPKEDEPPTIENPRPPSGGDGEQNNESDVIPPSNLPVVIPINGLGITIYDIPIANLVKLRQFMWSKDFVTNIEKIMNSPSDSIINLKFVPINMIRSTLKDIYLGNVNTGVQGYSVDSTRRIIDFGSINIKPYYNDYSDFNATNVYIYLPFIGQRTLNGNWSMASRLSLQYNIDMISGDCIAMLTLDKQTNINKITSTVTWQFNGNLAYNVPLTSVEYGNLIAGAFNAIRGNISLNNIADIRHTTHETSLSSNSGFLGINTPYIIISRNHHYIDPQYGKQIGYYSDMSYNIGQLSGYSKFKSVRISSNKATSEELIDIENKLKSGVIL